MVAWVQTDTQEEGQTNINLIISINNFNHNQHSNYDFYYMATSFDPRLRYRVKTSCQLIKMFTNCMLVVTEETGRYHDCYTNEDVSYKIKLINHFY